MAIYIKRMRYILLFLKNYCERRTKIRTLQVKTEKYIDKMTNKY